MSPSGIEPSKGSGMTCPSVSHSPKSIRRQRSLQKGRKRDSGPQRTGRPQVGQGTVAAKSVTAPEVPTVRDPWRPYGAPRQKTQQVRVKSTSARLWAGRPLASGLMKRMLKRLLWPLISGKTGWPPLRVTRTIWAGAWALRAS
jgi:hypothetical protein